MKNRTEIEIDSSGSSFRAVFYKADDETGAKTVEDIVETVTKEAMINQITMILQDRIHEYVTVTDPAEALKMVASTDMRSFNQQDWHAFAGCETKDPMISCDGGEFEIVVDGDTVNIIHQTDNYGGTLFKLVKV